MFNKHSMSLFYIWPWPWDQIYGGPETHNYFSIRCWDPQRMSPYGFSVPTCHGPQQVVYVCSTQREGGPNAPEEMKTKGPEILQAYPFHLLPSILSSTQSSPYFFSILGHSKHTIHLLVLRWQTTWVFF